MKLKLLIGLGAFMLAGAFVWYCTPLRYFNFLDHYGPSNDIAESKRRGVYLYSYKVLTKQPILLGDGVELTIKDSWLERQWKAGTFDNETRVSYNVPAVIRSRIHFALKAEPELPEWAREVTIPSDIDGGVYSEYDPLDTAFGRRWYFTYLTSRRPPTELSIPILRRNDSTKTVWVSADTIAYIHLEADDW